MNDSITTKPEIIFSPIGIINTPFEDIVGMPIQPKGAKGIKGTIAIYPQYSEGLSDLEGFSHLILLYHLHQNKNPKLSVIPFLDNQQRGIFATRSPSRPNPIGLSIVELVSVEESKIHIQNVDMLNGTPLIDIKPYVPEFDQQVEFKTGWFEKYRGDVVTKKSDERFR